MVDEMVAYAVITDQDDLVGVTERRRHDPCLTFFYDQNPSYTAVRIVPVEQRGLDQCYRVGDTYKQLQGNEPVITKELIPRSP